MPCINPLSLIFGITLVANEKTVLCCRLYKVWNTINIAEALMFVMKSTVTNIISRVKKRTRPVQFRTKQCFKLRKYWDLLWSLMIVVDKVSFNSSFLVFYWNLFFFVFVGFKKNVYSVCLNHMNNLDLELRIKTCAFETHESNSFPTLNLISMKLVNQDQHQRRESGALQCVKRARDLYRASLPSIQGIKRLDFPCIQISVATL